MNQGNVQAQALAATLSGERETHSVSAIVTGDAQVDLQLLALAAYAFLSQRLTYWQAAEALEVVARRMRKMDEDQQFSLRQATQYAGLGTATSPHYPVQSWGSINSAAQSDPAIIAAIQDHMAQEKARLLSEITRQTSGKTLCQVFQDDENKAKGV